MIIYSEYKDPTNIVLWVNFI